jgi:nucleotide-binding universal stress UspA family protein
MTYCYDTSSWEQTGTAAPVRFCRIVVGIDGSPNSLAALKVAVGLGARDGAKVEAVCVYQPYIQAQYPFALSLPPYGPAGEGTRDMYASPGGVAGAAADAQETLEQAVLSTFGRTLVDNLVLRPIEGNAHEVLTRISATADLLVVGARGHSGPLALILGSTAQACTRHAKCAVVVVPAPQAVTPRARESSSVTV